MKKEELIQEFESIVSEITTRCALKLAHADANQTAAILDEFQKTVAAETPKIIDKAISNDIEDRIPIITSLAEIAIKHANTLKSKVQ